MAESAIGLIETRGLVGVIEAADTAAKAADVQLLGIEQVGGGLVSVRFAGDVAAVKAAVEAASQAAARVSELVSAHVIARPHRGTGEMIQGGLRWPGPLSTVPTPPAAPSPPEPPGVSLEGLSGEALGVLSVTRLRQLARRTPGLALQGRQISRANKEQLIQALRQARRGEPAA
ncbi:MAG: BMC domain-containing protein [Gemmatimonadota bacterium]